MGNIKYLIIVCLLSFLANAQTRAEITVTNDQIISVGKVGSHPDVRVREAGMIGITIKDNVTGWPFSNTAPESIYPSHDNSHYNLSGEINQPEANKQILAVLLAAVATGKNVKLFISEDYSNLSQYRGMAIIHAASILQ